jgi:recombinational DNA repair protein (RecF pathway)
MRRTLQRKVWAKCARCQFDYPTDRLTPQLGLLVCQKCFDNLDTMYRPRVIQEALAEPKEADDNLAQRDNFQDPGELEL